MSEPFNRSKAFSVEDLQFLADRSFTGNRTDHFKRSTGRVIGDFGNQASPMTGLRIFTSNRLEALTDALADVFDTPLPSPLEPEIVIVQSKGMERWVSMALARRHGVCANFRFPFPNAFVYETFKKAVPELPDQSVYEPRIMTWSIMRLLSICLMKPEFESLRIYLGQNGSDLKRFQLSKRIADTFDQYLLFRPEMILGWESGRENHWQAVLWRHLVQENGNGHRAALGRAFMEAVNRSSAGMENFPRRISVFGISFLPRFHMQIFAGISRHVQVNLFLMNPCGEYWGDIFSDREIKRITGRQKDRDCHLKPEGLYMERGNSLLASMGALGRDFFDLINEFDCEEFQSFQDPGEISLLCCIQSDILNLRDGGTGFEGKKTVAGNDGSIRFHACHSPMREMEVLHDGLLEMFDEDPDLLPADILVMTPDIEAYAPYVEAVFGAFADGAGKIPYSIADRSARTESRIVDTFLAILDLWGGRYGSSQVFAILESGPVRKKFGISEADLARIQRWVKDTRIRWGIDERNRGEMGLPPFSENTWKAGMDRLLLGYSMAVEDDRMFSDTLPYDFIEGSEAEVLGRFAEFVHQLFSRLRSLNEARTPDEWSITLRDLFETFFTPGEAEENEMQIVRRRLKALSDVKDNSGFEEKIDLNIIRYYLRDYLGKEGFGFGFLSGGVTFCAMLPMRSIPFKIICMVGMNGDAFPRQARSSGFDLMSKHPRRGDPSRRNDDRYLFLEAILSARKKLYISFVGQNILDNSVIPPSVPVGELMDYIEQGFEIPGKKIGEHLIIKHRMQAFSPAYFKPGDIKEDSRLFSYSRENLQAARCLPEPRKAPAPFISSGLPIPEAEWKTVDLTQLCLFYRNPARFLLNRRLGLYLEESATLFEDTEPFELKGLDKYLLEQDLVEKKMAGRDPGERFRSLKASGRLPHGIIGDCLYERIGREVNKFVEKTRAYIPESSLEPLEINLNLSGFQLTGRIDGIYPESLIRYRYAAVLPKDRLDIWILHLALNCVRQPAYPPGSMLFGLDANNKKDNRWAAWEYLPVTNSEEILGDLLAKYWKGLFKPIHFFPASSWRFAHSVAEKKMPVEQAEEIARSIWNGNDYIPGESRDPYYALCFEKSDPFDPEFREFAVEIFHPLLKHQKRVDSFESESERRKAKKPV